MNSLLMSVVAGKPDVNPVEEFPDGRYSHVQQVQERLNFLRWVI